jgi:hypothetical protein
MFICHSFIHHCSSPLAGPHKTAQLLFQTLKPSVVWSSQPLEYTEQQGCFSQLLLLLLLLLS